MPFCCYFTSKLLSNVLVLVLFITPASLPRDLDNKNYPNVFYLLFTTACLFLKLKSEESGIKILAAGKILTHYKIKNKEFSRFSDVRRDILL